MKQRLNQSSFFKLFQPTSQYKQRNKECIGELTLCREADRPKTSVHNVVLLRESVGDKNGQKLIGIRGIYQIRVSNTMEPQCIMHRNITCACAACVQSNYAF